MRSNVVEGIIECLDRVRHIIRSCAVYQNQVILVRSIVRSLRRSVSKCPLALEISTTFETEQAIVDVEATLMSLEGLIGMLSVDVWKTVALEWSVKKPMEDLKKLMSAVQAGMVKLDVLCPKYEPSTQDINADFLVLHKLFQGTANSDDALAIVHDKLNSVSRFLISRSVQLPVSPQATELADFFADIPELVVERSDFTLEKTAVGKGASGNVYRATRISTKECVAVKALHSASLDKYELASLKREVTALATLRHRYLVKFVGAVLTSPFWIITEFMSGDSLYKRLRDKNRPNGTDLTRIAYKVAVGMTYLHSRNIIHRDLKTLNILLDDNLSPRICDFGIAREIGDKMTGLMGTVFYMAPEIIGKNRYNLKADVFSFGMMLWEMLKCEVPFGNMSQIEAGSAILRGQRPVIPRSTPKMLQSLIKDCWQVDKDSRPSFDEIVMRMQRERIAFPQAEESDVSQFYERAKYSELSELSSQSILPSIANNEDCIRDANDMILRSPGDSIEKLIGLLDCGGMIEFFLNQDVQGMKTIVKLCGTAPSSCARLTKHVMPFLTGNQASDIISALLHVKEYAIVDLFIERDDVKWGELLEPFVHILMSGHKKRTLLTKFIEFSDNIEMIDVATAISLQSVQTIEKILGNKDALADIDTNYIEDKIINGSPIERECALRVSLEFSDEVMGNYSEKPELIQAVLSVSDREKVGKFLYRISTFQAGCENILASLSLLEAYGSSPFIMSCFIGIARYFPERLLCVDWVMAATDKCLQERKNVELALRVIGGLSSSPKFRDQTVILANATTLIRDCEYTSTELKLLLAIAYNCPDAFAQYYRHFLGLAEVNDIAMMILSRWDLPDVGSRNAMRLAGLIETHVMSDTGFGVPGACALVRKMCEDARYVEKKQHHVFGPVLNEAAQRQHNIHLLTVLVKTLKYMELPLDSKTYTAVTNMFSRYGQVIDI